MALMAAGDRQHSAGAGAIVLACFRPPSRDPYSRAPWPGRRRNRLRLGLVRT